MKNVLIDKSFLKSLDLDGFKWIYTESKGKKTIYTFQKQVNKEFHIIRCYESDLLDGNIQELVKLGMSREVKL